jgi:2'-5' RNA ligase
VRPESIHLTLKFLGETPVEKMPVLQAAVMDAVKGTGVHELALGKLGTFGGSRPRVVWVDLTGDLDSVSDLQERTEIALNPLGFEREARGWSPHVTVARVRQESVREVDGVIGPAIAAVSAPAGAIPVKEVLLMRSTLRPSGAVYERVAAFPLGGE